MSHYFFAVDSRKQDFIVYNANCYQLTKEPVEATDIIQLKHKNPSTPIIKELKSKAWSASCSFFFVLQDEGIYLMNVYSNEFFFCRKLSYIFIEMYLEGFNKKPVVDQQLGLF